VTVPRPLSPLVRTRTRQACTLGLLSAALIAASLPWWPLGSNETRPHADGVTDVKPVSLPRDETAAVAEAQRTRAQVLVETATTPTSLTWALPNGQIRTQVHSLPQRAKNAAGQWANIDTKLAHTGKTPGGLNVRPANAPAPVRFSGGSGKGAKPAETLLAEVDIDGHTIAYTWPGALPPPVLDGARALYPEVLPGVDLLAVAREEGGFAQVLIVKTAAAAANRALRSLSYGLRSEAAVFRHDKATGSVRVLDRKSGAEITSIPTPHAWDSAGRDREAADSTPRTSVATAADVLKLSGLAGSEPGARQAQLPVRLDGDGTGSARLHLDAAATGLLAGQGVKFPVFLDPTLPAGTLAWTTAYKPHPNTSFFNGTNFGSGTSEARVGYETDTRGTARSYWRMRFDTKLKGADVTKATFKVLNTHSWSCTAREFQLWSTGPISSGTTWNKRPKQITLQQKKSFAFGYDGCSDEYVAFNVADAAQAAATAGSANVTLGMHATSEGDNHTWRKFKASSAVMEVDYNRKPNEPTKGTSSPGGACKVGDGGLTVAKTNIVLSATATDPDGNLKGLRFRFWKTGSAVPAGTLVTNLSSGKGSVTIPTTTLVDKAVYSWDVRAEDSGSLESSFFPPGTEPCRLTVDASAPPAPDVESDVFLEATPDGATWSKVKFGDTGAVTFTAEGAAKFSYSFGGVDAKTVTATAGKATVPDLRPRHAGPQTLVVYAYDTPGNRSVATSYPFYLPPGETADGPGDTGGDGIADLLVIDASGNLRTFPGDVNGELYTSLAASYSTGGKLNPKGHWFDATTGQAALIAKYSDAYPGDGTTDLFARTPDGGFWLYPGDGYGSFNVDDRMRVMLPAGAPDPATWVQLKAIGDITGDKLPDLALRAGTAFWVLSGYTGGSFQQATLMEGSAWAPREIVNIADIDLDTTPDLVWRNPANGNMYVRHGKPGTVAGSVNLDSLKLAGNSRDGDVQYGTSWTATNITAIVGIPDVNNDRVPDMWVRFGSDGQTRIYHPTTTNTGPAVKVVLSSDWTAIKAFA
jgi:hypothetical protein